MNFGLTRVIRTIETEAIHKDIKMTVHILFAVGGYLLGAFTPAVLRKVKALFVKEALKVEAEVKSKV